MVSVPFYQVLRTTVPVFTVLIYRVVFGRTYENMTYLTLVPIMIGAALTTIGEYTFTDLGFLLTFAGVVLAAVKVRYFGFAHLPSIIRNTTLCRVCGEWSRRLQLGPPSPPSAPSETRPANLRPIYSATINAFYSY